MHLKNNKDHQGKIGKIDKNLQTAMRYFHKTLYKLWKPNMKNQNELSDSAQKI